MLPSVIAQYHLVLAEPISMTALLTSLAISAVSYVVGYVGQAIVGGPQAPVVNTQTATPTSGGAGTVATATQAQGPLAVVPDAGGPLIGIFGHRRIGGRVILSTRANNKSYTVIEIAGAPVSQINGVYINDTLLQLDASGNVIDAPWSVNNAFAVNIALYTGSQLVVDPILTAALSGWTSAAVGKQHAYARIVIDTTTDASFASTFSGAFPNFTFDVLGFPCYDPRDATQILGNTATYKYSENPAVIQANHIIHVLGMALPTNMVDWPSVTTAANVCDTTVAALPSGALETRYTAAITWTTDETHENVASRIGSCYAGGLIPPGAAYQVFAGGFTSPTDDFKPATYTSGGLSWSETDPAAQRVNGVRGTFTDALRNFETRDFPPYQDTAARAVDGIDKWMDLALPGVTNPSQAQRLARIAYIDAREGFNAQVETTLAHFNTVAGDRVTVTDTSAGFNLKPFRVAREQMSADMKLSFDLRYEPDDLFTRWNYLTDEKAYLNTDPITQDPSGLLAPGGALIDTNAAAGAMTLEVFAWPVPGATFDRYRFQEYANAIIPANLTRETTWLVTTGQQSTLGFAYTPAAGTPAPCYQVRAENSVTGAYSAWTVLNVQGQKLFSELDGATKTNTVQYKLPQARRPDLIRLNNGNGVLRTYGTTADRATATQVFVSSTNNLGTATLLANYANAQVDTVITGAPGTTKYYWAVNRNTIDSINGPLSRPLLVVF